MGRDKWLGGELGEDGNVYGIPGGVDGMSRLPVEDGRSHFACQAEWQRMTWQCIELWHSDSHWTPGSAPRVLKITPSTGQVKLHGPETLEANFDV